MVPGEDLGLFVPPPWPATHTDPGKNSVVEPLRVKINAQLPKCPIFTTGNIFLVNFINIIFLILQ
jgi:hypothetical protein